TWDAVELRRVQLAPGQHLVTSDGIDADNPRTTTFAPRFAAEPWRDVVTSTTPSDEPAALVVRHERDGLVYATVFGQLITAAPDRLRTESSATPWDAGTWTEHTYSPAG